MEEVNLLDSYKSVYSQQGQDGILEKVFDCIGTTNKYFVEFGSSGLKNGGGNTAYFREQYGWDGLLIDYMENPYGEKHTKDYEVKIHKMKASNVNEIFSQYNVPREMDLLSIDIDGQDFHVWHALDSRKFYPRVVCIECNYEMIATTDYVLKYDEDWVWKGDYLTGASMTAMKLLGDKKGYSLVSMVGSDCIFVRNDILQQLKIRFKNTNDVEELWLGNIETGACPYIPRIQVLFETSDLFYPSSYFLEKEPQGALGAGT